MGDSFHRLVHPAYPILLTYPTYAFVSDRTELRDGRILSWSWDKTLRMWNASGKLLGELIGHRFEVEGALELKDKRIISWSKYGSLRLWDNQGRPVSRLSGPDEPNPGSPKRCILLLHDGRILELIQGFETDSRLWELDFGSFVGLNKFETGQQISRTGYISRIQLEQVSYGHPYELVNGTILISKKIGQLNEIDAWSHEGAFLGKLQGHTGEINGICELSGGRVLSWSKDNTLRVWDNDFLPIATLRGHVDEVKGALELNGGKILSWSTDRTLRLWHISGSATGIEETFHLDAVVGVRGLTNGNLLSWSLDHTLILWDTNGQQLSSLTGHIDAVTDFLELADGRILSWSKDRTMRIWHKAGNNIETELIEGNLEIYGVIELSTGLFISWSENGKVTFRDRNLKDILHQIPHGGQQQYRIREVIETKRGRIISKRKGGIKVIQYLESIPELKMLDIPADGALELIDGRIIYWSWRDNRIFALDIDTGASEVWIDHSDIIDCVGLNDGTILSQSNDYTIRLWDCNGNIMQTFQDISSPVGGLYETLEGKIFTWNMRGKIYLLDRNQNRSKSLIGHVDSIYGIVSLGGSYLMSWSHDKALRIWDSEGRLITTYYTDGYPSRSVYCSNNRIVLGDSLGYLHFLRTNLL